MSKQNKTCTKEKFNMLQYEAKGLVNLKDRIDENFLNEAYREINEGYNVSIENELEENVERIFRVTKESSTRLILDMSDYFDISSQPQKNAILSYLREKPLPNHVIINCDLLKF